MVEDRQGQGAYAENQNGSEDQLEGARDDIEKDQAEDEQQGR